jgi:NACalpha-BTF3-like transcription factor
MKININTVNIETEDGNVACSEAEVSVAISNSVAMRIVPVDANGTEYPNNALGVVGDMSQEDIALFMAQVASAAADLMGARGI